MILKIYNSLGKKVQEIIPIEKEKIGMYVCGPTVYAPSHIGHARTWIYFDWLRRYLIYKGFKVKFVQNITDAGHLVGDEEVGEDKIEKAAKKESKTPEEISQKYEAEYFKDLEDLNILKPDVSPRATDHIQDIISYIKVLIDKGNAYEKEGNVYFEVETFPDYGKLSGRDLKNTLEDTRVQTDPLKKNQADFALWLKADSLHLQKWPSPWSDGYPGWHIECSVMAEKYLGQPFDIHGSATEHIFPHHENEIAQSEAHSGKHLANYFVHSGMLMINGQKMSKSLGNYLTIQDILKDNDLDTIKLAFMTSFWRKPFDWSKNAISEAKKLKDKLVRVKIAENAGEVLGDDFFKALEDDFNVSKALTIILENIQKLGKKDFEILENIFGLELKIEVKLSKEQEEMVEDREEARKTGDFAKSDKIRGELEKMGVIIEDTDKGPRVLTNR